MSSDADQHLLREYLDGVEVLKRNLGYNPTYFLGMLSDDGPMGVSKGLTPPVRKHIHRLSSIP